MVSLLKQQLNNRTIEQLFFYIKKIFIIVFILTTLYFILNTSPIFAQSKILINEFLIDPQPQSVEIFNSGTESADISDWIIDDSGGTTFYTIPKNNVLLPNQCLVFSADFNLNKTSPDTVKLISHSQLLIDSFSYKSSSGSGISYFRLSDGADIWTTGSANLGKFNSDTKETCLLPTMTPTPTLEPTLTIVPTEGTEDPSPTNQLNLIPSDSIQLNPTPFSHDNIYLSEVMANPPTGEKEWVEIYNDNDFSVSLNNWYIDDLENSGSSPKLFSLEINARSYGVFDLSSSIFNNDGDTVRLLDFNKKLKNDFEYQETEQEKTLGRISFASDDFCLQEPSKNSVNNHCIDLTPTVITSTKTPQITPSPIKNVVPSKISIFDKPTSLNKPLSIGQPKISGQVLGASDKLIINATNNKPLINLLTILSSSYSLLTIISILFRMKLTYGKDKNFFSPSLHSS